MPPGLVPHVKAAPLQPSAQTRTSFLAQSQREPPIVIRAVRSYWVPAVTLTSQTKITFAQGRGELGAAGRVKFGGVYENV